MPSKLDHFDVINNTATTRQEQAIPAKTKSKKATAKLKAEIETKKAESNG